jgi:hypothetical protein
MSIIIYDTFANRDHARLKKLLNKRDVLVTLETFYYPDKLLARLHDYLSPKTIFILLVSSKIELVWLTNLYQRYLGECRLVVVLPELRPELTSLTHLLFPRYLTDFSYNLTDVADIVENLCM